MTVCLCGERLNRHNVTGLCAECKLDARNARLSGQIGSTWNDADRYLRRDVEPMRLADAIEILRRELGGRWLDRPEQ